MIAAGSSPLPIRPAVIGVVVVSFAVGCGGPGNIGAVTGVVTLDGQPLPEARVIFQPQTGAPSAGITDASGRYELRYSRGVKGGLVGEHAVSISTHRPGKPDGDPPVPVLPERVPPRYNRASELTATIRPGRNRIDFALAATGTVPQPKPGEY